RTWMPGTSPGMTRKRWAQLLQPARLGLQAQPHPAKRQPATNQMDDGRRLAKKEHRQHRADDRPEIEAERGRHRAKLAAEIGVGGVGKQARDQSREKINQRRTPAERG